MRTSEVLVLVLNYNGRELLGQCLPSIVAAAKSSRHRCRLVVIDNSSSDDSCEYLAHHWPEIDVFASRIVGWPVLIMCCVDFSRLLRFF